MAARHDATPSLFDTPDVDDEDVEDWDEVPQARFLSWSVSMQLHYCWRRDLDAATRAHNDRDATFFLQRAAMYHDELTSVLNKETPA